MEGIRVIDIECVPGISPNDALTKLPKSFLDRVTRNETLSFGEVVAKYIETAGLFAEWGKIVSVSIGAMHKGDFIVKTICSRIETDILKAVAQSLAMGGNAIVGHNVKEFDGPYLMRRFFANGIAVPRILNTIGKKTWDIPFEDTMEMWSGSQWKHRISLNTLCEVMGVPSPKGDIGGADVAPLYYSMFDEPDMPKEKEITERIGTYNAGDVVATARVYCRLKGLPEIKDSQLHFLNLEIPKA